MSCRACQAMAREHAHDHAQGGSRSPIARSDPPRYGLDFVDRSNGVAKLQLKPRIGAANDPLEREADRMADVAMSGGFAGPVSRAASVAAQRACQGCAADDTPLQRKCATCEEESVRRAPTANATSGGSAESAARAVASGGNPLPPSTQRYFGTRFDRDFSDVRVHADPGAGAAAQSIGARAYTLGTDIAFAPGEYAPDQTSGQHLLAHELAHVVQQDGAENTIRRATLDIVPAGTVGPLTANQRRAAASCPISCGGQSFIGPLTPAQAAAAAPVTVGTLHAMPIFFHSSRGAILPSAAGANGIGTSLHFMRNGTNPVAGNPCSACTEWKIIQVLHTNQTTDPRATQDYVDNASGATPFYDDAYLGGTGLHPIPAGYPDAGDQVSSSRSIYDRPYRTAANIATVAGRDFFWEAEACVTCVKPGADKVVGCTTYGFRRAWVPTPPVPGAPAPPPGTPPAGAHGPVTVTGPGCLASPSAHFVRTLQNDPSTNTYQFET